MDFSKNIFGTKADFLKPCMKSLQQYAQTIVILEIPASENKPTPAEPRFKTAKLQGFAVAKGLLINTSDIRDSGGLRRLSRGPLYAAPPPNPKVVMVCT